MPGFDTQELQQALDVVQTALGMQPDNPELINFRGTVYLNLHQPERAVADFKRATQLAPQYATAYFNWGTTLHALGQFESALACYDQALAIEPKFMQAWSNKGNTLQTCHRLDDALFCYDQALLHSPHQADVQWNKALTLLLQGNFQQAWPLYEYRWQTQGFTARSCPGQRWLGDETLQNASLFVYSEQGLGDTIQFLRYLEPLIEIGAHITLEVPASLKPLAEKIHGLACVIAQGVPIAPTTFHCPLMSLPLALKLNTPFVAKRQHQQLQASTQALSRWQSKLGAATRPRVGLVMHGNLRNEKDQLRSIALDQWLTHLPSEFEYILLHEHLPDALLAQIATQPHLHFVGQDIHDFEDTAALCQLMDLTVSVDTSVAHLSASLNRPTWLLLPHAPDWRWQLERTDSPWYPSMRLFRQSEHAQWDPTLQTLSHELRRFLSEE
jgi:Tfp pilus assembly protein PilF